MSEPFDLIIIGGGINGAAIARDASMRGLKTIIFEKDDFGSGASSKTSKLAHGGIRYLERFQFGLVRESLKERGLLLKNASHLVRPLPFIFPVYKGDPRPLWQINLGLYLYDCLGGLGTLHRKLSAHAISEKFPAMRLQDLCGGCAFSDAQMLDNRIVIENVLSAEKSGAIVYNHTRVTDLIIDNGQIKGVTYRNALTGEMNNVYGRAVVNATGVWTADIAGMEPYVPYCRAMPTKGFTQTLLSFSKPPCDIG